MTATTSATWSVVAYYKGKRYAKRIVSGLTWKEADEYATAHQSECPTDGDAQGLWIYEQDAPTVNIYKMRGENLVLVRAIPIH